MDIFTSILYRSIEPGKLDSVLTMPRNYLGENILSIVPNLSMTTEGPVLTKLFLSTETFLCEVRLGGPDEFSFDVIDKHFVNNIRVDTGVANVSDGEEIIATYKTARIKLLHATNLATIIEFVGEERDEWLLAAQSVLPAPLCKRGR